MYCVNEWRFWIFFVLLFFAMNGLYLLGETIGIKKGLELKSKND